MKNIKIIFESRLFLFMTSICLLSSTMACNNDDEKNDLDSYKSVYGIWELEESSLGPGNVFSIEPNESVINFNVNAVASVESKAQKDYDKYFKEGDTKREVLTEFNSNNTKLLNVEETKTKIASLTYIQNELNGIPNLV